MLKIKCKLNLWDLLEVGFWMLAMLGYFFCERFLKELHNTIYIMILDIISKCQCIRKIKRRLFQAEYAHLL